MWKGRQRAGTGGRSVTLGYTDRSQHISATCPVREAAVIPKETFALRQSFSKINTNRSLSLVGVAATC